ncbi:hypothetical protein [Parenemella sanctibonifatiensis]|uniref:SMI1/KNR4 family protein n=1 Tax=Parenemella sanctibonifatiensis TaxID=2016505 RepID=A0A255EDT1_9ACTN|nr:hypothetical protein [Parenemella sanctibonifatiensis]OYN89410.1 hypothetical protein CGZ91_10970 [Parenemella sanctibonifatiensis]
MSTMQDSLPKHPHITIPDELEQAWLWMENAGNGDTTDHGYYLTPVTSEFQVSIVFTPNATLEGWFEPDSPAAARLLPIAELDGSGSIGALWLDDEDQLKVVGLSSEGSAFLLADNVLDFLTLVAIGYDELNEISLALPPESTESVELAEPFRTWLADTFSVDVPEEWHSVGDDDFTAWVNAQLGQETVVPSVDADAEPGTPVAGSVAQLLDLLGRPVDDPAIAETLAQFGVDLAGKPVTRAGGKLRKAGLEVEAEQKVLTTIWITAAAATPPAPLLEPAAPTLEDALASLGEPEWRGDGAANWITGGKALHLTYDDSGLKLVTLMLDWPGKD